MKTFEITMVDTREQYAPEEALVIKDSEIYELVVFNDEVNTFDHVIQALMDICDHSPEQAEQCTILIHYKGKCTVKSGPFDDLAPMRNSIVMRGINAEVV